MAYYRCTGNSGGSLKLRTAQGDIASFETNIIDTLQEVKCEINAKQDLHGEDKPYPAGGGVNIWDEEWEEGRLTGGVPAPSSNQIRSKNFCPLKPNTTYYLYSSKTDGDSNNRYYVLVAFYDESQSFISETWTNRLTFTSPANAYYFKISTNSSTVVYGNTYNNDISINYPSTDHDYHPYANVCPIVGYSSANITRCGVNLWDEEYLSGYYNSSGVYIENASQLCTKNKIGVKPNTAFCFVIPSASNKIVEICTYGADGSFIAMTQTPTFLNNVVFTTDANTYFININFKDTYGDTYNNDISINYPATDTTYHAYNGDTVTIAFGQTVYGGVLDVTRGKLRVTHAIIDLGSLSWNYSSGTYSRFYSSGIASVVKAPETADTIPNMLASSYEVTSFRVAYQQQTNNVIAITEASSGSHGNINIVDNNYSDADVFKTAVAGQTLAYELATPFDIDLTPVQIEALLGENNVWHDGNGDTEVKYLEVVRN